MKKISYSSVWRHTKTPSKWHWPLTAGTLGAYTIPMSGSYQYRYDRDRRPIETVLPSDRIVRNIYDQG